MTSSSTKALIIGSLYGGLIGSVIELIVLFAFPGRATGLQVSSSVVMRALLGFLFGGILVGTIVGLLVGFVGLSAYLPGLKSIMIPRITLATIITGGILGAFIWEIFGAGHTSTSFNKLPFLSLSGLFSGFIAGGNAGWMVWRVNQAHSRQRKDFELKWGKPMPTYEEHLRQTGQIEELKEHKKMKQEQEWLSKQAERKVARKNTKK